MQTSSRKLVAVLIGLLLLDLCLPLERMPHLTSANQTSASSSKRKSIPLSSSVVAFMVATQFARCDGKFFAKFSRRISSDLRPDSGRIFGNFPGWARRRARVAFVAGAEGEVAGFRCVWDCVLERLSIRAPHCRRLIATVQVKRSAGAASSWKSPPERRVCFFCGGC
jgi:hypothetical protein